MYNLLNYENTCLKLIMKKTKSFCDIKSKFSLLIDCCHMYVRYLLIFLKIFINYLEVLKYSIFFQCNWLTIIQYQFADAFVFNKKSFEIVLHIFCLCWKIFSVIIAEIYGFHLRRHISLFIWPKLEIYSLTFIRLLNKFVCARRERH